MATVGRGLMGPALCASPRRGFGPGMSTAGGRLPVTTARDAENRDRVAPGAAKKACVGR